MGKEIYVLEERCIGRGDAACHLLGRTLEEWGDDRADELRFYRVENLKEWLEPSLHRITENLKEAERKLRERKRVLTRVAPEVEDPLGMIARSAAMRRLVDLARRIAKVDSTVLITGESGTGKELIAHLVHDESARAAGPFIAVNCGAITESLLESELFGHARGAFTGAAQDRLGLFEAANGGTLLLDEIGEVSPGMQVKLLRVLQEREIRRVGENKSRPVNVRVMAATNRELAADIAEGRFRKDLYYRLNVVQLHVPPLRESAGGHPAAGTRAAGRGRHAVQAPDHGAVAARRGPASAVRLAGQRARAGERHGARRRTRPRQASWNSTICPRRSGRRSRSPSVSGPVRALDEIEKDYILAVLDLNGGNQTRTAEQLGIGSATLYRKLKSYGIVRGARAAEGEELRDRLRAVRTSGDLPADGYGRVPILEPAGDIDPELALDAQAPQAEARSAVHLPRGSAGRPVVPGLWPRRRRAPSRAAGARESTATPASRSSRGASVRPKTRPRMTPPSSKGCARRSGARPDPVPAPDQRASGASEVAPDIPRQPCHASHRSRPIRAPSERQAPGLERGAVSRG